MNRLQQLKKQLEESIDSFKELSEVFFRHTDSNFLNDYFFNELIAMAKDADYPVGGISGQLFFKLIN